MSEVLNVEEIFGSKVFTLGKMRERLPKSVYKEVKKIIDHGGELSLATADVVAKAMKDWAIENGATHYTHWFQPLTGITAEKHDAFVTHPDEMCIRDRDYTEADRDGKGIRGTSRGGEKGFRHGERQGAGILLS